MVHIYRFPHFFSTCRLVLEEQTACRYVSALVFNKELCSNQPGSVLIINHGGSLLCKGLLPLKELLCLYEHCFSHQRRDLVDEITTGLQLCRTLDIQEKHLGTLQVVSLHGFNAFSSQKNTPDMFHAPVCTL